MTDAMRDAQSFPLLSPEDLSLDLDRQRRLAKSLRDAARAGDDGAIERLKSHHPRFQQLDPAVLKLTDAQLVLAREAGLPSWPALKRHVEQIEAARSAIEADSKAPDADLPTLHIRCGNDIEAALERAGFSGDFLMVADPLCQGPLSAGPRALEDRAGFIATEYPGEDQAETLDLLRKTEKRLADSAQYGRIVLWFEHDPFDQLLLVKLLTVLHAAGASARKIELVSLDRFPGISKFIGIGQLSPAALRHLYGRRHPVPAAAFSLAAEAWDALCAPSALPLFELAGRCDALPFLRGSIRRYLAELPSLENGLSFTEQTILEILQGGAKPWGRVFHVFMMERDPLPYHGDLMFLGTMLRLRDAAAPALSCDGTGFEPSNWGKSEFRLTETGQALLRGDLDWKACAPRLRHHGGVTCFTAPDWRWDARRQYPVAL